MKLPNVFLAVLAGLLSLTGCTKHEITSAPVGDPTEPTQAQPRLSTLKVWLGPEELTAEIALTPEQERTGMMFRTHMAENDAMLFALPYPQRASFWMKNCPLPLSVAYIDPEGVIREIHPLNSFDTNPVVAASENIRYALETSQGWFDRHHIQPGVALRTERGTLGETFQQQR